MAEEFETLELEYSEEDILYYLVDEDDNEIGFVLEEDGREVEYYYEGFDADDYELVEQPVEELAATSGQVAKPAAAEPEVAYHEPERAEDHGYLHKIATIAGYSGNKARKKAEVQLEKVRSKAEVGVDKAAEAVESGGKKLKATTDDMDLGITREGVRETTANLNVIAKEGAETAKELKEAYDDIMEEFGAFIPKGIRRKLP